MTREPELAEWSRRSIAVAGAIALVAVVGSGLAILAATQRHATGLAVARPEPGPEGVGGTLAGESLPGESEFPVRSDDRRLLGGYLKGTGVAFVVLDTVRADRIAGLRPPPEGSDLFGVRLGVATDSEKPLDAKPFTFAIADDGGRLSPSLTVSTTGRLLPGPELNIVEAYFALERDREPRRIVIESPKGARLTLPAQPIESERGGESEGR